MSRIAVVLLIAAAVAFAGASGNSSASTAPRCSTSQLRIALTHTGAVTGVEGGYLRFVNRTRGDCGISGWPTAIAVEANGRTIKAHHAVRGTMLGGWSYRSPLPVITLKPGASAYAVIENGDNPVQNPTKPCPKARRLRIAPPRDVRLVTLSAWLRNDKTYLPLCMAYNGSPELDVSAVVPLSALPH
jgi:Domain of unknown function (DUF4232)